LSCSTRSKSMGNCSKKQIASVSDRLSTQLRLSQIWRRQCCRTIASNRGYYAWMTQATRVSEA
jgi:hypothetical protein